jgi:hypothetical protein
MTVTIEIPLKTPNMTNRREHHMARARRQKKHRDVTVLVMKAARVYDKFDHRWPWWPLDDRAVCIVTLTRVSRGTLDAHDNLRAALKSVVDGVADYFQMDDADPRLEWRYGQEKGPPCVRLTFEVVAAGSEVKTRHNANTAVLEGA